MMDPARDRQELERLRGFRAPGQRDVSIRGLLGEAAADFKRRQRGGGSVAEAWGAVVPEGLAARTAIVGVSRGTLTVKAEDSATRFELDRLLRSGAEAELIRRCSVAVKRVKVVV